MGSESSRSMGGQLPVQLQLPTQPLEQRGAFAHFRGRLPEAPPPHDTLSVFRAEPPPPNGSPPLDKCAQNLMKYRHPCILKYIWHWQQRGVYFLATESVQSLVQVLNSQDSLQICVGLHQVAQALDFIHSKASHSHNNIGIDSIYVTSDGSWKLSGLEFLHPFPEMNYSYLKKFTKYRYHTAVDENEESLDDLTKIDQFAFCNLVNDVFKGRNEDDVPHFKLFKTYCKQELQNPIASQRPSFYNILQHEFFNHEFISIHKFLTSLPLKTEIEKKAFFINLLEKLRMFNEKTIATQLAIPLLSRLVLLDITAREKLLPYILIPKDNESTSNQGLFSMKIFKQHITPQLIKMFKVRDTQVRLLLLKHFSGYITTFDEHDLTTYILPDLLLGIKDTDDTLVSMTLYCLADLIPILGASTVISAKRCKLFTDGRPLLHEKIENISIPNKKEDRVDLPTAANKTLSNFINLDRKKSLECSVNADNKNSEANNLIKEENSFGSRESIETETNLFLHERPSPDGGEDLDNEISQIPVEDHIEDSDENWSDWEANENKSKSTVINETLDINEDLNISNNNESIDNFSSNNVDVSFENNVISNIDIKKNDPSENSKEIQIVNCNYPINDTLFLQKAAMDAKLKKLADISELDIKNQKYTTKTNKLSQKDDFDFFTDMEPVIEKANTLTVNDMSNEIITNPLVNNTNNESGQISSKLSFTPIDSDQSKVDNSAWGDIDWDED